MFNPVEEFTMIINTRRKMNWSRVWLKVYTVLEFVHATLAAKSDFSFTEFVHELDGFSLL